MKKIGFLFWICVFSISLGAQEEQTTSKNIVILGLGGRAHEVLSHCLRLKEQLHQDVRVLAVSDDYGMDSLEFHINRLHNKEPGLVSDYQKMFETTQFYPADDRSVEQLFLDHPHIDKVFITSSNYDHFRHLNAVLQHSPCQNIYMEKPLFRSLDEWKKMPQIPNGEMIDIGLTLRYSNVAKIVSQQLNEHKNQLGKLKKVRSWEHVRFGHAFTAFMMSWRKFSSLSGGFLLEKSIHDIDLAFFFLKTLDIPLNHLTISTRADHCIFKKSNQSQILDAILNNEELRYSIERWDQNQWQRKVAFERSIDGAVLWDSIVQKIFEDFPDDADLDSSDIIPDTYQLAVNIQREEGDFIEYELDVKVDDFSTATKRGVHFDFEKGSIHVDIMKSEMQILIGETLHTVDLCSDRTDHAGGDVFIAHTIFDQLPVGQHKASYDDEIVQLSTLIGLISESQAKLPFIKPAVITKKDNTWEFVNEAPSTR